MTEYQPKETTFFPGLSITLIERSWGLENRTVYRLGMNGKNKWEVLPDVEQSGRLDEAISDAEIARAKQAASILLEQLVLKHLINRHQINDQDLPEDDVPGFTDKYGVSRWRMAGYPGSENSSTLFIEIGKPTLIENSRSLRSTTAAVRSMFDQKIFDELHIDIVADAKSQQEMKEILLSLASGATLSL